MIGEREIIIANLKLIEMMEKRIEKALEDI